MSKHRIFTSYQWTALMFASYAGNPAVVSRLVQVPGLDLNYLDDDHENDAEILARKNGHSECLRILRTTNVENQKFIKYCQDDNLEEVKNCLSRGVDVNAMSVNVDDDDHCWRGRWSGLTVAAYTNNE